MSGFVETMMYAASGGVPWHNKGFAAIDELSSIAAAKAGGIDWLVAKAPLSATIELDGKRTTRRVPGKWATYRVTDGTILGVVADEYVILQNAEAFQIIDSVMADVGIEAKYETCGSLKGGEQVFMTVKLPEDIVIGKGDRQMTYLFLRTGHDGFTGLDILPTMIRVVCWNTSTAAINSRTKYGQDYSGISLWHMGSVEDKIKATKNALNLGLKRMDEFGLTANQLAELPATEEIVNEFISMILPPIGILPANRKTEVLLPNPKNERPKFFFCVPEARLEKATAARDNKVSIFKDIFNQEKERDNGSLWGLYNAATGYSDHKRPHRWTKGDAAMTSVVFGAGAQFKADAFGAIKELAGI